MSISSTALADAQATVRHFTALAAATGAVPVPAGSVAIVSQNAVMFGAVGAHFGRPVTVAAVLSSLGLLASLNIAGRQLFVEGAKLLGWGTGPVGILRSARSAR